MGATSLALTLAGSDARTRVRKAALSIRDVLNDAPNTASGTIEGSAPTVGQAIVIGLNTTASTDRIFAGTIQTVDAFYEGQKKNLAWHFTATDYLFLLNRRRPFGTWTAISATTIAQALISTFTSGFTSTHVAASLPNVSITFDRSATLGACLSQLAQLVGGYWYVDYDKDLHFFQTESSAAPDPLDINHRFLNDPPITYSVDLSQIRTRVYGKGHGEVTPGDVLASETIVPVADAVMFNVGGGTAFVGTEAAGAQSQPIAYTGVQLGGGGSLVGPGAAPSTAPALALAAGAGLGTGVYQYAYTDVTAAGESLPSPLGSVTTTAALTPPTALTANTPTAGTPFVDAGTHDYVVTFVTATGETLPGTASNTITTTASNQVVPLSNIPTGPAGVTKRKIYRRENGAGNYKLTKTINDNTQTTTGDGTTTANLGAAAPTSDTTALNQVALSGIAIGASPTTSRKVYRTAVGASQLKLQQTIANNTATTGVTDVTADGSLGANVPTSDTSGISFAGGQVNAGSTSILTASAGPFASGGGWALTSAGQAVRYTGISGNTLTGIPASGPGALLTTVLYGSQILPSPALTGVTGLSLATANGSTVAILVQVDDVAAQTALAAFEGGDGIREFLVSDDRRGEASLIALCQAQLQLFKSPIVTVTYATRDPKTQSGKTILVNLVGYAQQVLADAPVGYWRLGEASGTVAADASGNAHPGTITGGVTLGQPGAIADGDTAMGFNGPPGANNSYVDMGAVHHLTGALSLEIWIAPGAVPTGEDGIVGTGYSGYQLTDYLDGRVYFYIGGATGYLSVAVPQDGTRHHLVGTWDGTTGANGQKLYLGGVLVAQRAAIVSVLTTWSNFLVGKLSDNNRCFNGLLDEPAVYNVALSAAQVAAHYALRTVTPGFSLSGSYVIQDVTISEIDLAPGTYPRYSVTASSVRFSLDAILRTLLAKAAA